MNCTVFLISRVRNSKWPAGYQTRRKVSPLVCIFRWKIVIREESDICVHSVAPRVALLVRGLDPGGTSLFKRDPWCPSGPSLRTEKIFLFVSLMGTRALKVPATRLWVRPH